MIDALAKIGAALKDLATGDLRRCALAFLEALGYKSDRIGADYSSARLFCADMGGLSDMPKERHFCRHALQICVLSQITEGEINHPCFRSGKGKTRSFVFVAVDLFPVEYMREEYAQMAREINRHFAIPALVLFRCEKTASMVCIARRPSKRPGEKHIDIALPRANLFCGVDLDSPYFARLPWRELSLSAQMQRISKTNLCHFDGLLRDWAEQIEEINRINVGLEKTDSILRVARILADKNCLAERDIVDCLPERFGEETVCVETIINFLRQQGVEICDQSPDEIEVVARDIWPWNGWSEEDAFEIVHGSLMAGSREQKFSNWNRLGEIWSETDESHVIEESRFIESAYQCWRRDDT